MPTIQPPEKHRSLYKKLFGQSEQENFAEGIKNRREGSDKADPSDFFFDPATSEISAPMGMMTRYMKSGIPDIATRIQGTEAFKKAARALGPSVEAASELFAERYPRVAAHMSLKPLDMKKFPRHEGITKIGARDVEDAIPRRTPVHLKPESPNAEESMLHEATHVAQELGSGSHRFPSMYTAAEVGAGEKFGKDSAYRLNPFEMSARQVANRKMGENIKPLRAMQSYDYLEKELAPGPTRERLIRSRRR